MGREYLFGIFLFLMFPLVSSAVVLTDDLDSKYSVGDVLEIQISLSSQSKVSDFVYTYLDCDSDDDLVDKRYVFLDNARKNLTLEFPVYEIGTCQIKVEFLDDEDLSEEFEISDEIEIVYDLNSKSFLPLDVLLVSGEVEKANGEEYSGVLTLGVEDIFEKSVEVIDGKFNFTYTFLESVEPDEYDFFIKVSEEDGGGDVLNSGEVEEKIEIKSKPTSINLEGEIEFNPPYNYTFSVELLDQVGDLIENESSIVRIFNPENKVVFEKSINSSDNYTYSFLKDSSFGTWDLNAYYGNIFQSISFDVLENKEISVSVEMNNIIFTNVGNVPYVGVGSINLEGINSTQVLYVNLTLDLGESYEYYLDYSGEYNISSMGKSFLNRNLITGAAISSSSVFDYFGLLVILIFLGILSYGYSFTKKKTKSTPLEEEIALHKEKKKFVQAKKVVEEDNLKRDVYMVFVKSKQGIGSYEGIVSKYGFKFNELGDNLGYVVFYGLKGSSPEYKMYQLSTALLKFGNVLGDDLTIVLNKGYFEKKISLLKKFALLNRKLVEEFPNSLVIGDKVLQKIAVRGKRDVKIVEVIGMKIKVWLFSPNTL